MADRDRYLALDALRGIAVMGILLMNIVVFAMPGPAYFNPRAWGGESGLDLAFWFASFVLVDGKMRGLFTLLFGASTLLVIQRADMAGQSAFRVHYSRMAWLMVFGLAHYYLIWEGDILFLYGLCGLALYAFREMTTSRLVAIAILLLLISFVTWAMMALSLSSYAHAAGQPGASDALVQSWHDALAGLGAPGSWVVTEELKIYSGSYADILAFRLRPDQAIGPVSMAMMYGVETLGMMLLGMALFRTDMLNGAWPARRYLALAAIGYAIGLPAMIALGWSALAGGFDVLTTYNIVAIWSFPFRMLLAVAHASLLVWLIVRLQRARPIAWIAATGRAAFTNYLGTSILMTTIFYGYGLGLFGEVSRAQCYLFVIAGWIVMLAWSKPWLDRFAYGPLEWLWRSLAKGQLQRIRI